MCIDTKRTPKALDLRVSSNVEITPPVVHPLDFSVGRTTCGDTAWPIFFHIGVMAFPSLCHIDNDDDGLGRSFGIEWSPARLSAD